MAKMKDSVLTHEESQARNVWPSLYSIRTMKDIANICQLRKLTLNTMGHTVLCCLLVCSAHNYITSLNQASSSHIHCIFWSSMPCYCSMLHSTKHTLSGSFSCEAKWWGVICFPASTNDEFGEMFPGEEKSSHCWLSWTSVNITRCHSNKTIEYRWHSTYLTFADLYPMAAPLPPLTLGSFIPYLCFKVIKSLDFRVQYVSESWIHCMSTTWL